MHIALRKRAIILRQKGYSYNLIRKKVLVSKSTLTNWLSEIPYIPNETVKRRVRESLLKFVMLKHEKKLKSITIIKSEARRELLPISDRDLKLFGLGLYLGEGSKSLSGLRIVNADPRVIKIAILWLEKIFGVGREHFVIRLHLYPDCIEDQSIRYWSRITGLSKKQFYKTQFDRRTNKLGRNRRKLRFGTAHLSVKSLGDSKFGVQLYRRIISSIDAIFENFGIMSQENFGRAGIV